MRFKPNLAKIQGTKNNCVYSNQLLTRCIYVLYHNCLKLGHGCYRNTFYMQLMITGFLSIKITYITMIKSSQKKKYKRKKNLDIHHKPSAYFVNEAITDNLKKIAQAAITMVHLLRSSGDASVVENVYDLVNWGVPQISTGITLP